MNRRLSHSYFSFQNNRPYSFCRIFKSQDNQLISKIWIRGSVGNCQACIFIFKLILNSSFLLSFFYYQLFSWGTSYPYYIAIRKTSPDFCQKSPFFFSYPKFNFLSIIFLLYSYNCWKMVILISFLSRVYHHCSSSFSSDSFQISA